LVLAGLAVLGVGAAVAQPASASPFLPPAAASSAGPTAGAPIEFRGFMETGDGMRFRLYDPSRKAGAWVKLNEREPTLDVVAKQFSGAPDGETLVVEHQGRTLTLAQRVSKVVSSGAAVQNMPPPPPMNNVPPAVTQAVVVNPTPADEAKRLEAVASEVARRRALREQAAQQMGQGAMGVPQVVQPPMPQPQQQPVQPLPQGAPMSPGGNQQRAQRQRP
jgi:hypothetical protein